MANDGYLDLEDDDEDEERDDDNDLDDPYGDDDINLEPRYAREPYKLCHDLVHCARSDHPLRLRVVQEQAMWGRARINFGQRYLNQRNYRAMGNAGLARFEKSLDGDAMREGSMELNDDGIFKATMGIRRGPRPTEGQVAKSIYNYDARSDAWSARHVTEDFYPTLVYPYVAKSQTTNPFDWAFERVEIANGFTAVMGLSHDCPLPHIEYPYKKMASRIGNTTPEQLIAPRTIMLDEKGREYYENIKKTLGEKCTPETMWFLLIHRDVLSSEIVNHPDTASLLEKIPACLHNGLIIDRLDQVFQLERSRGVSSKEALQFSLELITSIYSGENRPWWFAENIDFSKILTAGVDNKKIREIARLSGFAFEYAMALYRDSGDTLSKVEGLTQEESLSFSVFVASTYGIGNTSRAKNIITFTQQYLERVTPSERASVLRSFQKHLQTQKPATELIGKLEGEDSSFHLPGVTSLIKSQLGTRYMEKERLDPLTVQVNHLLELSAPLARPLLERAKTPPSLDVEIDPRRMLSAQSSSRMQLPVSQEHQLAHRLDPLHGLFSLYQQIVEECGEMSEQLTIVYFSFLAPKMPDPFAPPKGLLKLLKKYQRITDPEYDHIGEMTRSPWRPEGVIERNTDVVVNKYLIIANLVDAWIMGIISEERLMGILSWVVDDPSPEVIEARVAKIREQQIARSQRYFEAKKKQRSELEGTEFDGYDFDERDDRYFSLENIERNVRDRAEDSSFKHDFTISRYNTLKNAHAMISMANILVTFGLLQPEDLHSVLNEDLEVLASHIPKNQPAGREREVENGNSIPEAMAHLKRLKAIGLMDLNIFRKQFTQVPTTLERIAFINAFAHEIPRVTETLEEIRTVEGEIFRKCSTIIDTGGKIILDELESLLKGSVEGLESRCMEIWKDSTFVTTEGIRAFLARHFDQERYIALFISLQGFRTKIAGPGSEMNGRWSARNTGGKDGWSQAVSHTTAMVGGLVTMMMLAEDNAGSDDASSPNYDKMYSVLPKDRRAEAIEQEFFGETSLGASVTGIQIHSSRSIVNALSAKLEATYPKARELILTARRESIGLVPVGGKIQVLHAIDESRFNNFRRLMGMNQTIFRLIHAGTSLILPPTPSANELKAVIQALRLSGVVDTEYPEIQISCPGRLHPKNVAIRDSAVMLASTKCIEYDRESFCTTHDHQTGARKSAYDAGGVSLELPFMSKLTGRTDSLGHIDEGDIDLAQRIHTVLIQGQIHEGPFADLAQPFMDKYQEILKRHKLGDILNGSWIYLPTDNKRDDKASDAHYRIVKKCTDAYFSCRDQYQETGVENGVIFEVRALFDWLQAEIQKRQEQLYLSGTPCTEVKILLEL